MESIQDLTEKQVDDLLEKQVKRWFGLYIKIHSGWFTGLPDRLVILPGVPMRFVELKGRRGKLSDRQKFVIKLLRRLGVKVDLIWDRDGVERFAKEIGYAVAAAPRIELQDNSDLD